MRTDKQTAASRSTCAEPKNLITPKAAAAGSTLAVCPFPNCRAAENLQKQERTQETLKKLDLTKKRNPANTRASARFTRASPGITQL
jgi:hypothetical protein